MIRLPFAMALLLGACGPMPRPGEPVWTEAGPVIDRFSAAAGHLMTRDAMEGLPGPGQPIDLDRPPFITLGLGPDGVPVRYYNFDVQSPSPAPRYVLTRKLGREERARLPGQLDLVDVIPGQLGYSDFWQLLWVEVPETVSPGSIQSVSELLARGYPMEATANVVNCPVVPAGSKARLRRHNESPDPDLLGYRGAQIFCMTFDDPLFLDGEMLPTSPIYVTFRRDPDQPGGGPPAGFRHEPGTQQTHNVVFSVPGDNDYSPLWDVHIYASRDFDSVHDADSALQARRVAKGPLVNCPIATSPPRADR
jgi:hypothetical protein